MGLNSYWHPRRRLYNRLWAINRSGRFQESEERDEDAKSIGCFLRLDNLNVLCRIRALSNG
jgi:hypothetical protein